jgi:CHASE2 domain-containing sensor protein
MFESLIGNLLVGLALGFPLGLLLWKSKSLYAITIACLAGLELVLLKSSISTLAAYNVQVDWTYLLMQLIGLCIGHLYGVIQLFRTVWNEAEKPAAKRSR